MQSVGPYPISRTRHRGLPDNRGAGLIIMMVAIFLMTALMVIILNVTSSNIHLNNRHQNAASALGDAESKVEMAALWLRNQTTPPLTTVTPTVAVTLPGPAVQIIPDPNNGTQFLKMYTIRASGVGGNVTKAVEVVVRQATFGKYAYFTDRETSSGGGAIWWNSADNIDGPVHSNNTGGTNFNINYSGWSTYKRAIFQDTVTGAGNGINYSPSKPTTETEFTKIFKNGSTGYKLGVQKVLLPPSTDLQKQAAWGATTGFPTTTGVYLRADSTGGVYIQGDSTIAMSLAGGGNQVMTVKQGTNTTVLTFDKTSGTISTTGPMGSGSPTSAASFSNGVVYCSGNITSLAGTIADNKVDDGAITRSVAFNICTDTNAGKDITITGDLVYNTRPDKTLPATDPVNLAAATLGLVARSIRIADGGAPGYAHPNREINAVMLAGSNSVDGSVSVNNYSLGSTGTLKVIGGLIQSTRGPVGTLSGGTLAHGYAKDYRYDPRLASTPPPFYPTTGQYDRISWRVKADGK